MPTVWTIGTAADAAGMWTAQLYEESDGLPLHAQALRRPFWASSPPNTGWLAQRIPRLDTWAGAFGATLE